LEFTVAFMAIGVVFQGLFCVFLSFLESNFGHLCMVISYPVEPAYQLLG